MSLRSEHSLEITFLNLRASMKEIAFQLSHLPTATRLTPHLRILFHSFIFDPSESESIYLSYSTARPHADLESYKLKLGGDVEWLFE